jgi:hypothetical protein
VVGLIADRQFAKTRIPAEFTDAMIKEDPAPAGEDVRILAGASRSYIDRFGHTWQSDRYFTGGTADALPHHVILGTGDPLMYRNRRDGAFHYDIPLKPGAYELRLHFAETFFGESNVAGGGETSRLFTVAVNGTPILDGVDVIADAGPNVADIRVFKDIHPAPDGLLHLDFRPVINVAFLNAIEIMPGLQGRLRPIRIIAQEQPFTDKKGRTWNADRFFRGGQLAVRQQAVLNTAEPELYHGERFGNLTYAIPVAPGRYAVILHFAETWFGPDKPQHGGVGSRIFDLLCNGVALAQAFDIFKEAGGGDRALERVFHGLEPNSQGKLILSFVPIHNYPCVDAIEVIDESDLAVPRT